MSGNITCPLEDIIENASPTDYHAVMLTSLLSKDFEGVLTQKTAADKAEVKSSKDTTPRHHYERTTGSAEDGLLITSPSRDKIEPIVPDESLSRRSSRRTPPITSPMKDGPSRRRSNRASSAARPPLTKDSRSSVGGRSISVGPENRSPKRTSRPPSTLATAPTTKPERRPRPTSLSTSSRRKGTEALPHRPTSHDENKESKKISKAKPHEPTASPKKGEDRSKVDKKAIIEEGELKKDREKEIIPKDGAKDGPKEQIEAVKESTGRKSTPEPRFDPEKYEPVVKTPPEPTRVKSPDQAMVKSPDPVNWTVPLDTGKTFTVTHNIPEGDSARGTPSSEHRHVLESRTRQTPEPTKISQGPLVGTPLSAVETKVHSQEQSKPATATSVEPKIEEKPFEKKEKKSDSSKTTDTKTVEAVVPDVKAIETKVLDTKTSESKAKSEVTDTKSLDTKVELKPSDSKIAEKKPSDTKVQAIVGESKAPEVKPFDTKSDPKVEKTDIKPCDTKIEPSFSESSILDPKSSEYLHSSTKPGDLQASDSKSNELKGQEPRQDFDPKKSESASELKSMQPQQLHQPLQQVPPMQASPTDILPPSSGAVDPMSMSMFGSLNGMNGKSSGTPSPTKPEVPLPSSEPTKGTGGPESKPAGVRNVPGTNLRCLDDPSFMFDQPGHATTNSPKMGAYNVLEAPMETSKQKTGSFRVLEAPEAPSDIKDLPDQSPTKPEAPIKPSPYRVLEAPIDPPARPKGSPYRVLEAPDAPYYPQPQTVGAAQDSNPPSLVSPSSGRTVTDALDKARTRFDSFWGGPKDKDPPSKV
ncbi:hypothetical protein SK128_021841 [Halocaridina rubra]|uniref:Nuclear protein MDM1 n=1 Tax=Halocaridina rubra TaxID=373956 RepID=A0AAN8X728_HALRR